MKSSARSFIEFIVLIAVSLGGTEAYSDTYSLPADSVDLVGKPASARVRSGDTLLDIARRFDIGRREMELANPGVSVWLPEPGQLVLIPSQYLLPDSRRTGLVLNLPEMRLFHYQLSADGIVDTVATYPVSIGQYDWQTPLGSGEIVLRRQNPAWNPPESIREEAEAAGRFLPSVVPPGPNNPLGEYALSLDLPSYLLHGTNKPLGIGMRVTHGCVRLYPEDIKELFHHVAIGTPIEIVNQPVKLGWSGNDLYLEVHPPLQEFDVSESVLVEMAVALLHKAMSKRSVNIRSSLIRQTVKRQDGVPVRLSLSPLSSLP